MFAKSECTVVATSKKSSIRNIECGPKSSSRSSMRTWDHLSVTAFETSSIVEDVLHPRLRDCDKS